MRIDLSYYLPVGISQRKELTGIGLGLAASGLWSMGFLGRYLVSYRRLFLDFDPSTGILNGNTMDSFSVLMGNGLAVFCLYWLSLVGLPTKTPILSSQRYAEVMILSQVITPPRALPPVIRPGPPTPPATRCWI